MAKDKSQSKEERKAAKKAAKEAAKVESNGVSKSKQDKKEKKEKKAKKEAVAEQALKEIQDAEKIVEVTGDKKEILFDVDMKGTVGKDGEVVSDDEEGGAVTKTTRPIGALVPFANPLADEKVGKKVFKSVKKAAAQRTLKRGVKEVVKALRKSPTTQPPNTGSSSTNTDGTTASTLPIGVVILAADISPMDVISHIPVLCEDHNIPYIYVTSRAELGMAGQTKRPTSVVMVSKDAAGGKKGANAAAVGAEGASEWNETFKGLVKTVEREGRHVKI